jgi:hypothetical protein
MPEAQHKRCFQCGGSFPRDELTCPRDGAPLTFELIGRRWRVESLLARRPGGGVFSVTHTISGTRAVLDLVPWPLTEDHALGGRLHREVQALRLLDQQPHVPPLLETGADSDGSRFLVTRITDIQPLPALLPALGPLSSARAAAILRPVLATLSLAHRLGVGHGQLGAPWIFAAPGSGNEIDVRLFLRGLISLSEGQVRQPLAQPQVQEDLRAAAALLHELITGRPIERNPAYLDLLADRRVKDLLARALGPEGFPSAEAFSRALSVLADAPAAERATAQAAPLGPGIVQIDAARMSGMLPLLRKRRATNQALPLPLAPLPAAPLRGGFTHELRQVSLIDMMDQEERAAPAAPPQETLAVARNRPFTTGDLPVVSSSPLPWSDGADEAGADEGDEGEDMEIEVSFSPQTRTGPPEAAPQAPPPLAPAQVQAPAPPRSTQTPAPPRSTQTPAPPRSAQTPAPPPRSTQTPPPSAYTPAPPPPSAYTPAQPSPSGLTPAAAPAWAPPAWTPMPAPTWASPAPPARKGLLKSPLFWLLFGMTFAALVGLILLILLRPGLSRF